MHTHNHSSFQIMISNTRDSSVQYLYGGDKHVSIKCIPKAKLLIFVPINLLFREFIEAGRNFHQYTYNVPSSCWMHAFPLQIVMQLSIPRMPYHLAICVSFHYVLQPGFIHAHECHYYWASYRRATSSAVHTSLMIWEFALCEYVM